MSAKCCTKRDRRSDNVQSSSVSHPASRIHTHDQIVVCVKTHTILRFGLDLAFSSVSSLSLHHVPDSHVSKLLSVNTPLCEFVTPWVPAPVPFIGFPHWLSSIAVDHLKHDFPLLEGTQSIRDQSRLCYTAFPVLHESATSILSSVHHDCLVGESERPCQSAGLSQLGLCIWLLLVESCKTRQRDPFFCLNTSVSCICLPNSQTGEVEYKDLAEGSLRRSCLSSSRHTQRSITLVLFDDRY